MPTLSKVAATLALASMVAVQTAEAWSNHALLTWPALAVLPELQATPAVKVETLADFIAAEPAALAQLLNEEEAWARAHVPHYAARPDALAFEADHADAAHFLAAVRVAPQIKLALYLQLPPGAPLGERTALPESAVTTLKTSESSKSDTFVALHVGERAPVIDVLASAVDEPDYGMDLGLFADNGTAFGRSYGFGNQPFGNPTVEWSSQAPFHMGFFHEASIVYKAAPYLQLTFPEYRIHMWRSLASFALAHGHPYWGWRFAGWGLHYLQDLTQPYHSSVLPGVGLTRMLGINALDVAGVHGPKNRMVQLVTNRHSLLEEFERYWMYASDSVPTADAARKALQDLSLDWRDGSYTDAWPRHVVSARAQRAADAIDEALVDAFPSKYVDDPTYLYGITQTGIDPYAELAKTAPAKLATMQRAMVPLLGDVGALSRTYVRSFLPVRGAQK